MSVKKQDNAVVGELTNNEKGVFLEDTFFEFMKSDLGYKEGRTRVQMRSELNNRGVNVDIVVRRPNKVAKYFTWTGYLCSLMAIYCFAAEFYYHLPWFFAFVVFFICLQVANYIFSNKLSYYYAWVECKHQKDLVTNEQVQITLQNYSGYKKAKRKKYWFTEHYFVSSNGFSEGALKLAQEHNILCYIYKNRTFEYVPYWN